MKALLECLSLLLAPPISHERKALLAQPRKATVVSLFWRKCNGKQICLPDQMNRELSVDWDCERMRCWPRPKFTVAQAEVIAAKAMCCVLAVAAGVITSALQVLA
jgi:hypothetical protein